LGGLARLKVGPRAVVVSNRVFWIDLDRFTIVGDCAVLVTWIAALLATQIVCKTAKGIGNSIFGIDFNRLIIIGDGPVMILLRLVGVATVPVGMGILWSEFDRPVVV
jgi:hypothetical protein